jgi:hypothetical protein
MYSDWPIGIAEGIFWLSPRSVDFRRSSTSAMRFARLIGIVDAIRCAHRHPATKAISYREINRLPVVSILAC